MRSCIRIPRLFVPKEQYTEKWAVPSPAWGGKRDWERVAGEIGDAPSLLPLVFPDFRLGEANEAILSELTAKQYSALEGGVIERLNRGCMLVERKGAHPFRCILANVDLEEYSPTGGKDVAIRPLTETDPETVALRLAVREHSVLEFPHTLLCYRDKKDKIMRELEEEDLEQVYEIALPDGTLTGSFLPDFLSDAVIRDIMGKADPCFGVLSGNHDLEAAKRYWERRKAGLSLQEARNHPARFSLAGFVNLCDLSLPDGAPDISGVLSALKSGKRYPIHTFSGLGERYLFEGREITYD